MTLESLDQDKPGLEQQTAPINPRDTARLSADVKPGSYRVAVDGDGIRSAKLLVGRPRPSAQNELAAALRAARAAPPPGPAPAG